MLNAKQQKFVTEYVINGRNGGAAAVEAGWSAKSADQEAWRQLQKQEVLDAIHEESLKRFASKIPIAMETLEYLMANASSETVRLNAAMRMLDQAGLQPPQKHEVTSKREYTEEELDARIAAASEQLGITNPLKVVND